MSPHGSKFVWGLFSLLILVTSGCSCSEYFLDLKLPTSREDGKPILDTGDYINGKQTLTIDAFLVDKERTPTAEILQIAPDEWFGYTDKQRNQFAVSGDTTSPKIKRRDLFWPLSSSQRITLTPTSESTHIVLFANYITESSPTIIDLEKVPGCELEILVDAGELKYRSTQ